jgi:hypothetical protein
MVTNGAGEGDPRDRPRALPGQDARGQAGDVRSRASVSTGRARS